MARASAFQAEGHGFEARFPLQFCVAFFCLFEQVYSADVAQVVEHVLGKDVVTGSSPVVGSTCLREETCPTLLASGEHTTCPEITSR